MKVAIVGFSVNQLHRKEIQKEMVERGHVCDLYNFSVLHITNNLVKKLSTKLSGYDVVHFIYGPGNDLTKKIQANLLTKGVFCPNGRSNIVNIDDKIAQMFILSANGIPVPKSVRLVNSDINDIKKELGLPFVLKDPYGMQGKEVHLCNETNFKTTLKRGVQYLGQEFIDYQADYRVHVAGDKAFCTYERTAPKGDFRANVSLGGSMKKVEDKTLLSRLESLALNVTKALSADYGGIDIISDKSGKLYVLEFNKNPGFKNVTRVTKIPFFIPISDYYESLVN